MLPSLLRGLRPARARGDGVRDARRRARTPGALPETAGGAARLDRARRRGDPRRRARPLGDPAERAAARTRAGLARARSSRWDRTAREVLDALLTRQRSQLARRSSGTRRAAGTETIAARADAAQPGVVEGVRRALVGGDPRVPDDPLDPEALALRASSRYVARSRVAMPLSVVSNPSCRRSTLPSEAGQDSSVSHTGLRRRPAAASRGGRAG